MHVIHRNAVILVVFASLLNKNQSICHRLLHKLQEHFLLWHPTSMMMNFKKTAINEFEDKFATTTNRTAMSSCLFRLRNNIQRKLQMRS